MRTILKREFRGLPLNAKAVIADDQCLYVEARGFYGSWREALRAAGIPEPEAVFRRRRRSRDVLVRLIRERARDGKPLNFVAMNREGWLANSGQWHFGSWDQALLAAGVDSSTARKMRTPWTRECVILAIRERHQAGLPVNSAAISVSSLRQSGQRLFGAWDGALRAAGLDPENIRCHRSPWTRTEVIRAIRERAFKGVNLAASRVRPHSLPPAARNLFGSWAAALLAAGVQWRNRTRGKGKP